MNELNPLACAGVIVTKDNDVVIVKTHSNNYGFPKGKRKNKETVVENAFRELYEESGITPNMITIAKGMYVDEMSNNNNPSIRYLIAKFIGPSDFKFVFNPKELSAVKWYNIDKAAQLVFDKRKPVLHTVKEILANPFIPYVNGSQIQSQHLIQ